MVSIYEPYLITARADRDVLDMNKRIREEQDQAYQKALEIDRQKVCNSILKISSSSQIIQKYVTHTA